MNIIFPKILYEYIYIQTFPSPGFREAPPSRMAVSFPESNPRCVVLLVWHPGCHVNPFVPTVAFKICCPRDCVSRHNGGTAGAPLKPLRDDSAHLLSEILCFL